MSGAPAGVWAQAGRGQMLRLETGSPGEGSEVRLWGRVTAQRGYCRGQGDLDEDVGSGGGWPQPGPTGARECELDQSCSRWAGLAFTPLAGQSSGRGPPPPTPHSGPRHLWCRGLSSTRAARGGVAAGAAASFLQPHPQRWGASTPSKTGSDRPPPPRTADCCVLSPVEGTALSSWPPVRPGQVVFSRPVLKVAMWRPRQ